MEKRILAYRKYMDELLTQLESGAVSELQLETLKQEHLTRISFFQHERLVHLIVTVTFAILEMLAVLIALFFPGVATLLLVIVIMILLIPYIRHYFILENEVQKMYGQYDRLRAVFEHQYKKTNHLRHIFYK